jgi:hypothetical protein
VHEGGKDWLVVSAKADNAHIEQLNVEIKYASVLVLKSHAASSILGRNQDLRKDWAANFKSRKISHSLFV